MVWLLAGLTFFHVLAAIGWWGSTASLQFLVVPAAERLGADEQAAWWRSLTAITKVWIAPDHPHRLGVRQVHLDVVGLPVVVLADRKTGGSSTKPTQIFG